MPFERFGYKQSFKGIVIDTNLLLLLAVGLYDKEIIKSFKRTQKYSIDDFEILTIIISYCGNQIYTTPNILTEITNLANSINNNDFSFFKFLSLFAKQFIEITDTSNSIIANNNIAFFKLGLTDASIANFLAGDILIITDDLPLYHLLSSQSKPVINYNHLRTF